MSYPVFPQKDDDAFFAQPHLKDVAPAIRRRILIERAIVRRAVKDAIAAGFCVRVHNGEDYACERTQDPAVAMGAIQQTDMDRIDVLRVSETSPTGFTRVGWLQCVYGNDGWDVISNNTVNLDDLGLLKGASELANNYED
jgi:hypothetical protein